MPFIDVVTKVRDRMLSEIEANRARTSQDARSVAKEARERSFLGGPLERLPGYDRQAQRIANERVAGQERMAVEEARARPFLGAPAGNLPGYEDEARRAAIGRALREPEGLGALISMAVGEGERRLGEQLLRDRGNVTDPATETYRRQLEYARQFGTLGQHRGPGLLGQAAGAVGAGARAAGGGLADIARGVADAGITLPTSAGLRTRGSVGGELTTADVVEGARTEVPYSEQVMEIAGEVGRRAAQDYLRSLQGPLGARIPVVNKGVEDIPVVGKAQQALLDVVGKGGEVAAESVVPTEAWMLALEFIPEIGSVPDLMRAVREGSPEAIRAVRMALRDERVAPTLRRLGSEAGGGVGGGGLEQTPEDLIRAARGSDEVANAASSAAAPVGGVPEGPSDPILAYTRLRDAIKTAERLSPVKKAAIRAEKGKRVGAASAILKREGAQGFEKSRGQLAGEYTAPTFDAPLLNAADIHAMRQHLADGAWTPNFFDRISADDGLVKLLSGSIPGDKEIELLEKAFPGLGKVILAKRSLGAKAWEEMIGVLGIPQTLLTAIDFSGFLRQSAPIGAAHPRRWKDAVVAGAKAARDPEAARVLDEAIYAKASTGPLTAEGVPAEGYGFVNVRGHLSSTSPVAGEPEPQFASLNRSFVSGLVQRIPGIGESQRAYAAILNKIRTDVYADVAQQMWGDGVRDLKQYEALANTINHSSGYGDFAPGQITKGFNAFFSARNVTARFQFLLDPFVQPGSLFKASARREAAKNLVGFAGYNATVLGMIGAMGALTGLATVELDPRSADWGKGKFGDTRVDLTGGYGPMLRLFARLATMQTKTQTGQIKSIEPGDLITDFFRGKLGPVPGLLVDALSGKTGIGEDVNLTSPKGIRTELYNRMVPFFVQDINEAIQNNPAVGIAVAPLAFAGAGVQTYGVSDEASARQRIDESGYNDIPDRAIASLARQRGWKFTSYDEFVDALTAEATRRQMRVEDVPLYKEVQAMIRRGRINFRNRRSDIDALLVQYEGATPRTVDAAVDAANASGIKVPVAAR